MSRQNRLAVATVALLVGLGSMAPVSAATSRISMRTARHAALARVPGGSVRSAELEREHGRLIYSFDIHKPGRSGIQEVHVDAYRGTVLSVTHENAVKERAERIGEGVKRATH